MSDAQDLNELAELRQFIIDAITRADPTLDTGPGSALDQYLINPLLERLGPDAYNTPILDFIRGRLTSEFSDLVVQDGEPIDDLVVKPLRALLQPYRRVINLVKLNQSLKNPEVLSDEEADNLGANYFSERKEGAYSVGIGRLYFTAPQFSSVNPSNPLYTATGLRFFPVESQSIRADAMIFNTESGLYYFDIAVQAEAPGSSYDIDPGGLISIEGVGNVVKVTNKLKFAGGGEREDTPSFLARLEQSLTEKSLVTTKGIVARLSDIFDSIRTIQVIGHGDPEMNRDILSGSDEPATYAFLTGNVQSGTNDTLVVTEVNDGVPTHLDLYDLGAEIGDTVYFNDIGSILIHSVQVTEVVDAMTLRVAPNLPTQVASVAQYAIARSRGIITISGIPGGVIELDTPAGEIQVKDGEVHIGGRTDVFIRGGDPQENNITLESIRDDEPLHFGLDLESQGEVDDVFINVTSAISSGIKIPVNGDELLVKVASGGYTYWYPTDSDVGRYLQILSGVDIGTYEILDVIGPEYDGADLVVRIQVALFDEDSGITETELQLTADYDLTYRIREKISVKDKVRDRDNSNDPAGINFLDLGVEVGDSLVIETGDDAGVFSIRRVLSSIGDNDTLVLDRALTKTVIPTGLGDGSGLRYRVNDELNVDLVEPRVTKIPLGAIFLGEDLYTVAGSAQIEVKGSTNFLLAGVEVGDILEILEGDNKGKYVFKTVGGTIATLVTAVSNTESGVSFKVYREFTGVERPLVRVKEVELLDSSGQPTGIKIPYGDLVDVRVKGDLSNRAEGNAVESYSGYISDYTTNRLYDAEYDFEAKGVLPDDRISIYNTSNLGDYKIKAVAPTGGGGPWWVDVYPASEGGKDFRVNVPTPGVHYRAGVASAGIARMYFVEPTSVEVQTGLAGGRLQYREGTSARFFSFSEVEGELLLPYGGSGDENPRGLRVVRTFQDGGDDFSILEFTDDDVPGVFGLELQEGDLIEIFEQIPFRDTVGDTFEELGIFGTTAGLLTLVGSNKVSVPQNSLIDFVEMNSNDPLVGQLLYIDSGPDEGQYIIEEVIDSKSLRLNTVMTSTTGAVLGKDITTPRDGQLKFSGSPSSCWLKDATDSGAFGTQIGYYITIFEAKVTGIEGAHEIKSVSPVSDPDYPYLELDLAIDSEVLAADSFSWIRTATNLNVMQEFRIYNSVPLQTEITEIATKESDTIAGVAVGDIITTTTMFDPSVAALVAPGDRVEVLLGDAAGVYTIASVNVPANTFSVYSYKPFPATGNDIPYRIWGGIHGSRRMVTVGSWEGGSGLVLRSYRPPFRVRRPAVYRVSSTEMQDNFDGALYYADIQIESEGVGDELNLPVNTRLVKVSGVQVDGYTYTVGNNTLTFSPYEQVSLNFERRFLPAGNSDSPENMSEVSGKNLKIVYELSSLVGLINDFIRSDTERTTTASAIARHFLPSYVYASIFYRGGDTAIAVGEELENHINSLNPTDELEVSDLVALVVRNGADYVRQPIDLSSVTHDINRNLIMERSQDKIGGVVVPYEGSARISSYFAVAGEGLRVQRES